MSILYGTRRFAVEGEYAAKVYDAVINSNHYKTYPDWLTLDYKDGVLFIVEDWTNYPVFGDYVLPFLIGDNYYWMECWEENGKVTTNDKTGKYFTI